MKKLLTFLIGLLMIGIVLAQPVPSPVKFVVSVNGYNINYANTQITNKLTEEILTKDDAGSLSIVNGVGHFDLSDFEINPKPFLPKPFGLAGNTIEYKICDVHPKCTGTFLIDNFEPRTIKVSIVDETIVKEKYLYQCQDGSWVASQDLCPVIVVPPKPEPEPQPIPEPEQEISDLWKGLIALAIIVLGIFGWGKGFTALANY